MIDENVTKIFYSFKRIYVIIYSMLLIEIYIIKSIIIKSFFGTKWSYNINELNELQYKY